MKDCKTVLRVSAKAEKGAAVYLSVVFFISAGLIVWLALVMNGYVLIFLILLIYIFRMNWKKFYRLSSEYSVVGLSIDYDDQMYVEYMNGTFGKVILIDLLHINKTLVLFFSRNEQPVSAMKASPSNSEEYSYLMLIRSIKYFVKTFIQEISFFLNHQKIIFIVSQESLGKSSYRELLRRVYLIK